MMCRFVAVICAAAPVASWADRWREEPKSGRVAQVHRPNAGRHGEQQTGAMAAAWLPQNVSCRNSRTMWQSLRARLLSEPGMLAAGGVRLRGGTAAAVNHRCALCVSMRCI